MFYSVPFPPKFNVPFYIVLCTIYPTFCVCHLILHSRFNFLQSTLIFNFDLCNIQIFAFDIQLFHKKQSSFRIRPSSSVECTFIVSHPTFRICAFWVFASDIRLWALYLQVSAFDNQVFELNFYPLVSDRWLNWLDPPPLKWWSSPSRDFLVEWTRETFTEACLIITCGKLQILNESGTSFKLITHGV